MGEFWAASVDELQQYREQLGNKILEICYIEEFRTRLLWLNAFFKADCRQAESFVQRYVILFVFSLFQHWEELALAQHPTEEEFIKNYWIYLRQCCYDALKIECTRACESGIPRMVESLREAWQSRTIPVFESFQVPYDLPPPSEEPVKRKPNKRKARQAKQMKMEELKKSLTYHHLHNAANVVCLFHVRSDTHVAN